MDYRTLDTFNIIAIKYHVTCGLCYKYIRLFLMPYVYFNDCLKYPS